MKRMKAFTIEYFLAILMCSCLMISTPFFSLAADFPSKPIQLIVPYQPGGPCDTAARIIGEKVYSITGQMPVVLNKPGGGSAIGIQSVLQSPADGYSVLVAELSIVMLPLVTKNVGFTVKDFSAFHLAASAPMSLFVKQDAPWKNLEELVAYAKENPGKISFAGSGPASVSRFTGELFQLSTGVKITHVPMEGATPSVMAVLGGHVGMSFLGFQVIRKHLEASTLRVLAVTYDRRLKSCPDIPTAIEKGYPKLTSTVWVSFFVPAKTPAPITKKLGEIFHAATGDKRVSDALEKTGLEIENMDLEKTARFIEAESAKWAEVANTVGISPK